MRAFDIAAIAILTVSLGACARRDADDTAARKAGRTAYDLAQETKEAAKKAGTKIKEASHELHEGWKEAKHDAKESGRK
ncbi:MAG: hypothetical protein M3Y27_25830 [Acidobacteriota bacterium]|nr:hypothetical protein [Acidobacteriota bacterium]